VPPSDLLTAPRPSSLSSAPSLLPHSHDYPPSSTAPPALSSSSTSVALGLIPHTDSHLLPPRSVSSGWSVSLVRDPPIFPRWGSSPSPSPPPPGTFAHSYFPSVSSSLLPAPTGSIPLTYPTKLPIIVRSDHLGLVPPLRHHRLPCYDTHFTFSYWSLSLKILPNLYGPPPRPPTHV